jgi:hypothetical protein
MPDKDKPSNVLQFPITAKERDLQIEASRIENRWREQGTHVEGLHLTDTFMDDEGKSSRIKNIIAKIEDSLAMGEQNQSLPLRRVVIGSVIGAVLFTGAMKFGGEALSNVNNNHNTPHNIHHIEK